MYMGKYILLVGMKVADPAKEAEFNDWYNNTHFPDVLETPNFVKATRWEHTEPKPEDAKYLALYEIETDDIQAAMKGLNETMAVKSKAGRMSNLGTLVIMGTYKQLLAMDA
jgi:hypothetical protein